MVQIVDTCVQVSEKILRVLILVRQIVTTLLALVALTVSACADATTGPADEKLALIAGAGRATDGNYLAGLSLTMSEGWHTYWRQPGDSGIAPQFDWSGSRNLRHVEILWPVPQRFDAPDDVTYGYATHVVWPLRVVPVDPSQPVELSLMIYYGVCSDICVPVETKLELKLPADGSSDDVEAINAFLERVPSALENSDDVSVVRSDGLIAVTLKTSSDVPLLVAEGAKGVWFGAARAERMGDTIHYEIPVENNSGTALSGTDIRLTFAGPDTALEVIRKLK